MKQNRRGIGPAGGFFYGMEINPNPGQFSALVFIFS